MQSRMSGFSVDTARSTKFETRTNIKFIYYLFTFFALELVIAFVFSSFSLYFYDELGSNIAIRWETGIIVAFFTLLIMLLTFFIGSFNTLPYCFVIYTSFVILFTYTCAFLSSVEKTHFFYFGLSTLTMVAVGLFLFFSFNPSYLSTIEVIILTFSCALIPSLIFLMISNLNYIFIIVIWVFTSIYCIFLTTGIIRTIRNDLFNINEEHPASSAVKIFIEGFFGFCRAEDILGSSWGRRKQIRD